MNKRLEQERAADQEDLESKMAAIIDDLQGSSSQQEKTLAKLGFELSEANEVIATLKKALKETNSHTEIREDEVELIEKLGKGGGSGELWMGKYSNSTVAVKVYHGRRNSQVEALLVRKEAGVMEKLRHINVISFLGAATEQVPRMIIMELAECNLYAVSYTHLTLPTILLV